MLLSVAAPAQPSDIPGWNGIPWGSTVAEARTILRGQLEYRSNGVTYQVKLGFFPERGLPKRGLASVTLSAPDDRGSFMKALAELTKAYGRPALRSEYDGDREATRTTWEWVKPHGKVSLEAEDGETAAEYFTVLYEAR